MSDFTLDQVRRVLSDQGTADLALWAIDALCEPPAEIRTGSTKIGAELVRRGRAILEREEVDIDWRTAKASRASNA